MHIPVVLKDGMERLVSKDELQCGENLKSLILSLTLFVAPRETFFRFRSENLFSRSFSVRT